MTVKVVNELVVCGGIVTWHGGPSFLTPGTREGMHDEITRERDSNNQIAARLAKITTV